MATAFTKRSREEINRINRLQRRRFDELFRLFEPPLPEGVPEKLEKIVFEGNIQKGDSVLDVGSGVGILIPWIRKFRPARIHACDLSGKMLEQLKKNYPDVWTARSDIAVLDLPDASVDVVFINACYPNIADKTGAFTNIARMMKAGGRMVVSHPLGKNFVQSLKQNAPYPLDHFPEKNEAEKLFRPYGFIVRKLVDVKRLYLLRAVTIG